MSDTEQFLKVLPPDAPLSNANSITIGISLEGPLPAHSKLTLIKKSNPSYFERSNSGLRMLEYGANSANPITEGAIWNKGWELTASQAGSLIRKRGMIFDWLGGNNLDKIKVNYPAADYRLGGVVGQIKSTQSTNAKTLTGLIRSAAKKLTNAIKTDPNLSGATSAEIKIIVPTGTKSEVIGVLNNAAENAFNESRWIQGSLKVITGIPGKVGFILKGTQIAGGVFSVYQLVNDIKNKDVRSGIGSAASVTSTALWAGGSIFGCEILVLLSPIVAAGAIGYTAGNAFVDTSLGNSVVNFIADTINDYGEAYARYPDLMNTNPF